MNIRYANTEFDLAWLRRVTHHPEHDYCWVPVIHFDRTLYIVLDDSFGGADTPSSFIFDVRDALKIIDGGFLSGHNDDYHDGRLVLDVNSDTDLTYDAVISVVAEAKRDQADYRATLAENGEETDCTARWMRQYVAKMGPACAADH